MAVKSSAVNKPTLQIHLTDKCNLKCAHCYSHSGRQGKDALSLDEVIRTLESAFGLGYERVAFSGGEPVLVDDFPEILRQARLIGFTTSFVTNGTLLDRFDAYEDIDLIAVSLDGLEDAHNQIRCSGTAFYRAMQGIETLKQHQVNFGIITTVTKNNFNDLESLTKLALESGACLFQLHPVGSVGRASADADFQLSDIELTRLYLESCRLEAKYGDLIQIHVDVFNAELVRRSPSLIYTETGFASEQSTSQLINPLVVKSDGTVLPVSHGVSERYQLGNVHSSTSLSNMMESYLANDYFEFNRLRQSLWDQINATLDWPYFSWYERLEHASHEQESSICISI